MVVVLGCSWDASSLALTKHLKTIWGTILSPFCYKTGTMGQIGSTSYVLPIRLSYCTLDRVIRVSILTSTFCQKKTLNLYWFLYCTKVSTTPITAMGCRQILPLSVVQLKGKHCRKPKLVNVKKWQKVGLNIDTVFGTVFNETS